MNRAGPRHTHSLHPTGDEGEWIHTVVTWRYAGPDQRTVTLFLDGRPSDETPPRIAPWVEPGEFLYLGGGHPGNDKGRGAFDDLMIFDRALEAGDVRVIMNLGSASFE
jgi:hypothetical protein